MSANNKGLATWYLISVKLHGRKSKWISSELPSISEQRLGAEKGLFAASELYETILKATGTATA